MVNIKLLFNFSCMSINFRHFKIKGKQSCFLRKIIFRKNPQNAYLHGLFSLGWPSTSRSVNSFGSARNWCIQQFLKLFKLILMMVILDRWMLEFRMKICDFCWQVNLSSWCISVKESLNQAKVIFSVLEISINSKYDWFSSVLFMILF